MGYMGYSLHGGNVNVQKLHHQFKDDTSVAFVLPSMEDIPLSMLFNQYPATFIYANDDSIVLKLKIGPP